MRVAHVNDIAGVSTTLVTAAAEQGEHWQVWPVPAGRGSNPLVPLVARAAALAQWLAARHRFDVWHVHYGVTGYYGWAGRRPVVLHLHGTDLRSDLHSPWLGPVVRRSIRAADRVLYSTLDMAPALLRLRPDAEWFPAPVPPDVLSEPAAAPPTGPARVFFASRWDDSKGGLALVQIAEELKRSRPSLDLVGIGWGTFHRQAAQVGVRLLPVQPSAVFRQLLAESHVVVGQLRYGSLGVADLQTLATGRPLVGHFDDHLVGPAMYDSRPPLLEATGPAQAVAAVLHALDDRDSDDERAEAARAWVRRHHSPYGLAARASAMYRELAG